jgi:hypothetical protein
MFKGVLVRGGQLLGAAGGLVMLGMASAHAALPAAATTALTDIGTAVDDVEAGIWPVIAASLVVFGIIKLVKRGANKV